VFTLKHQDGDTKYGLEKAGYWIEDSKLFISIKTKAVDSEAFPDSFYFAVDGYVLTNGLESSTIVISTNPNDEPPNVYIYTTFHASEVIAKIEIDVLSEIEISIRLSAFSEDVNYYDERAKRNEFVGDAKLENNGSRGLWMPS